MTGVVLGGAALTLAAAFVGWLGALARPRTWVLLLWPLRLRRSGRPEITPMVEVSV